MEPTVDATASPPRSRAQDLRVALGRALTVAPAGRADVGGFVGGELLSGVAGWSAGLGGSWLVSQFFVARGLRNLWGLAARGDRTVVSGQTYEWLGTIAEYVIGLAILLVVQRLVGGTLQEYAALRSEPRATGSPQ